MIDRSSSIRILAQRLLVGALALACGVTACVTAPRRADDAGRYFYSCPRGTRLVRVTNSSNDSTAVYFWRSLASSRGFLSHYVGSVPAGETEIFTIANNGFVRNGPYDEFAERQPADTASRADGGIPKVHYEFLCPDADPPG